MRLFTEAPRKTLQVFVLIIYIPICLIGALAQLLSTLGIILCDRIPDRFWRWLMPEGRL